MLRKIYEMGLRVKLSSRLSKGLLCKSPRGLSSKLSARLWITVAVSALVFFLTDVTVNAGEDSWPLVYEGKGDAITYLTDVEHTEVYEVKAGDTLWKIAEEKMGSGSSYRELAEANSDLIADPGLILPGMMLQMPSSGVRLKGDSGYKWEGYYRYAIPPGWTVGYLSVRETGANFNLSGSGMENIACLVQDRDSDVVRNTRDWETCCEQIRNYVKVQYPDAVTDLDFCHYQTEEGEDVYLYSYTYEMDLAPYGLEGSYHVNVCMGTHLTEHMQAQFLGLSNDTEIQNQVLYVTGTFRELGKPQTSLAETSNMAIGPVYSWELSGMFNPFPWVEQFYDELMREILDIPEEQSRKEKFLEGPRGN